MFFSGMLIQMFLLIFYLFIFFILLLLSIVKDAKEYFQLAIENNPANYLIKSLFAMFLDDCGLMAEV